MIKKILLGLVFLLMITSVYANEPTPETNCCMLYQDGWTTAEECSQYDLNEERCNKMVSEYESLIFWMDYGGFIISLVFLAFILGVIWVLFKILKKKNKKRK